MRGRLAALIACGLTACQPEFPRPSEPAAVAATPTRAPHAEVSASNDDATPERWVEASSPDPPPPQAVGGVRRFVFISSSTMPEDRTMLSLDRDRTEWLWVPREEGYAVRGAAGQLRKEREAKKTGK